MIVDAEMTKVSRLYIDWFATARSETEWVKWVKTNSMTSRINVNVEHRTRREKRYIFVDLIWRHYFDYVDLFLSTLIGSFLPTLFGSVDSYLSTLTGSVKLFNRHYDLSILFVDTFLVYINCLLFLSIFFRRHYIYHLLVFFWRQSFTRDVFSKSSI